MDAKPSKKILKDLRSILEEMQVWSKLQPGHVIILEAIKGKQRFIQGFQVTNGRLEPLKAVKPKLMDVKFNKPHIIFNKKEEEEEGAETGNGGNGGGDDAGSLWDQFWDWLTSGTSEPSPAGSSEGGLAVGPGFVSVGGVNPTLPPLIPGGAPRPATRSGPDPRVPPFEPFGGAITFTFRF